MQTHANGYNAGHPWYYVLNGKVESPKQILEAVKENGYQGYMAEDIREADRKPGGKRTEVLHKIKSEVLESLRKDISAYRQYACWLHRYRRTHAHSETAPTCEGIHVAISLKYCHIYNDMAHLHTLDHLLSAQPDLFGF